MLIRILTACVMLCAVASLPQFNPHPFAGNYQVVVAERQAYTWMDSLSPWGNDALFGYRLELGSPFTYGPGSGQTNLCLHGYYKGTDYIWDYLTGCMTMTDTIVSYFRFWDTSFSYFPVHGMIASLLPNGQPASIGYDMSGDTLSLSTIWVRLGDQISFLVPGHWPMDTVAYFCRRAIAKDPVLKTWTREDWDRNDENSKITRFTWKLLAFPDAIAGSRRPEAIPPLAPGRVDARGRRLPSWAIPQPGFVPFSR